MFLFTLAKPERRHKKLILHSHSAWLWSSVLFPGAEDCGKSIKCLVCDGGHIQLLHPTPVSLEDLSQKTHRPQTKENTIGTEGKITGGEKDELKKQPSHPHDINRIYSTLFRLQLNVYACKIVTFPSLVSLKTCHHLWKKKLPAHSFHLYFENTAQNSCGGAASCVSQNERGGDQL